MSYLYFPFKGVTRFVYRDTDVRRDLKRNVSREILPLIQDNVCRTRHVCEVYAFLCTVFD
jgi:hypothetical protein